MTQSAVRGFAGSRVRGFAGSRVRGFARTRKQFEACEWKTPLVADCDAFYPAGSIGLSANREPANRDPADVLFYAPRRWTRTQSTSISCGNVVVESGLPGQLPPTATFNSRKNG